METLVLDCAYQPIRCTQWQRAMVLWSTDKVEVLEHYEDRVIRWSFNERGERVPTHMPSVVRFIGAVRRRDRSVRFSRDAIYARDSGRCQYCHTHVPRDEYTYDHVKPRKLGGRTEWTNVVVCCFKCNQRKGARTPQQAGMNLLVRPIRPAKAHAPLGMNFTWRAGMPDSWRQYDYGRVEEGR